MPFLYLIGCFPILCLLVVVPADVGTSSTTTWWRSLTWTMKPWSTSASVESTAPKFTTNVSDAQLLNLKSMWISTAEHVVNFNVRVCPCSQPIPRCAEEILERLHVVLSEDQRPELTRPAQKEQSQHHEARGWGPYTVSEPPTIYTFSLCLW